MKNILLFTSLFFLITSCSYNISSDDFKDEIELDTVGKKYDKLIKKQKTIPFNQLDLLKTKIILGAGSLYINGISDNLFHGRFAYNYDILEPRVKYTEDNNIGLLKVLPKKVEGDNDFENYKNIWNLEFTNKIPIDLDLKFGAGLGEFNFGNLNVRDVEIKLGAGKVDINFNNNKTLNEFELQMGVGDVTLNFSDFKGDTCYINIEGGIGKFTLLIPENYNSKVYISKGLAKISAPNLDKNGDIYYYNAQNNKGMLNIRLKAGIGKIDIITKPTNSIDL